MALVPSGRAAPNRLKSTRWWFGVDDRELENLLFVVLLSIVRMGLAVMIINVTGFVR